MICEHANTDSWVVPGATRVLVPSVRVTEPGGAIRTHTLVRERALVGTGESADIRLCDTLVSRTHCELVREAHGVRLRDLGSRNGSWIGGQRVLEAVLSVHAEVRVGRTTLRISPDPRCVTDARWRGGDRFFGMVGHGPAMHAAFAAATRVADLSAAVLVRGESGTGKELFARALHAAGSRASAPFVVVDCAALAPSLADLDLFGHARGALAGATHGRPGVFERAAGGTLFLDHVDALPLCLQAKLLRVIDTGVVRRLGDRVEHPVDVRVIASAVPSLEALVRDDRFRDDLFYRLSVFTIDVPPLRQRRDDIRDIARDTLAEIGAPAPGVERAIEIALANRAFHPWPGNVRELRTLIRRIAHLGKHAALSEPSPALDADSLPHVDVSVPFQRAKQSLIAGFERAYTARLLAETDGNVAEAARRAGLARAAFHRLLARLS